MAKIFSRKDYRKQTTPSNPDTDFTGIFADSANGNKLTAIHADGSTQSLEESGGGSGGVSIYEATVGATGADYTTLGSAIADGKTRVLVIDDTTETGDITMPSNLVVDGTGMNDVNINMGAYSFLDNSGSNTHFNFSNLKITFAKTVAGRLFLHIDYIKFDNVYFDNNSTVNICYVYQGSDKNITIQNCYFDLPNYNTCGINIAGAAQIGAFVSNCTFNGGGSDCYTACTLSTGNYNNLRFEGTFNTSKTYSSLYLASGVSVDNIYVGSTLTINIGTRCIVSGIYSANKAQIVISSAYNCVSNVGNALSFDIDGDYNKINNVICNGFFDIDLGAINNSVCNSTMIGGVKVDANDNTITGCQIGDDAGGGSNTITVTSNSNRTIISGCRTDAAILDSGTDTTTGTNVVY